MKKIYSWIQNNISTLSKVILCVLIVRILIKPNLMLSFIVLINLPVINLTIVSILVLILVVIIFKKENLTSIVSPETVISIMGIFIAFILFAFPNAYDKFERFQNLQYITDLNCKHAQYISQQKIENLPYLLLKQFNYEIYTKEISLIVNYFSTTTLSASQDSVRDMSISNNIIEKIQNEIVQNNFISTRKVILLSDTLTSKSIFIASTTCDILKPEIDKTLRHLVDRTTLSAIRETGLNFLKMVF